MSDGNRFEWDAAAARLVWHRATPLSREELRELARIGQRGWEGAAIREVLVAYSEEGDALVQADAVSFAGATATWGGQRIGASAPVVVRKDFGLE